MSGSYGAADERESEATLHHALDVGINLLDTADSYGDGHNESLLGRVVSGRRREFLLATKTGWVKRPGADGTTLLAIDATPKRLRAACDASLARLRTDVIDLYYLHRVDPQVPVEESVGALAELVTAGKVRAIGLSEVSADTLRRAHATHPVTALQSEYSLWTRNAETDVMPACAELGIAFVPFSPLGRGFLTGAVADPKRLDPGDWRVGNPRFSGDNWNKNTTLLEALQAIARRRDSTPGQIALAWVLAQGEYLIPIPGTKRRAHLDENVVAVDIELTPEDLSALDTAFPLGAAAGDRYTADHARWVGR